MSARPIIFASSAGLAAAVGWWVWIDAVASYAKTNTTPFAITFPYYLPGIFATIGAIMLALVPFTSIEAEFEGSAANKKKVWLFFAFVICGGSLVGAIWIMAAVFVPLANTGTFSTGWPAAALLLQPVLLTVSGGLFNAAQCFSNFY